ncbi:hypothetical protein KDK67_00420 [Methanococcoides seepicolus]|uniref:Uncharacterized protein n=1 Tax=Methanococcoides seepicolus TaxID=2828780 RepID=A0A9E4ZA75_9EURY|nr:hypothetical protein [Methanococcoides seepicolus]
MGKEVFNAGKVVLTKVHNNIGTPTNNHDLTHSHPSSRKESPALSKMNNIFKIGNDNDI